MDNTDNRFQYTYSAAEQSEVERIRRKYLPREENKLEQLRRLDRSTAQKAQAWALTIGVLGTLIFGAGMSLCLTELTGFLGGTAMLIGVPVGLVGLVLLALAYPLYNRVLRKERERVAPEVLRLTEELMK